ncbi:hypothetical protein [Moorena sp. SIO3I6]|nr:hypothetical protein [Moorena sp. SIO3I6]NEO43687.1 hypothetical protein [Moorena sp. SIO4A3]
MPSNGLWLSESVWFTAHPTSTVINPLVGSGEKCYDLVNQFGSLPTLHQL